MEYKILIFKNNSTSKVSKYVKRLGKRKNEESIFIHQAFTKG